MSRRAWTILLAAVVLMVATAIALQPSPLTIIKACLRSEAWPSGLFHATNSADARILIAYIWIPITLLVLRPKLGIPLGWIFSLFAAFIISCGLTHGLAILTGYVPWYWLAYDAKEITADVSLATAAALQWVVGPKLAAEAKRYREALETQARQTETEREGRAAEAEARAEAQKQAEAARKATAEAERTAGEARTARAAAEEQALAAQTARAETAKANQALAEINARLERERTLEATRAQSAEARSLTLEQALRRLEAQDEALRTVESPIMEALDGVLVSVLVGAMSSERAADWTLRLMEATYAAKPHAVVIDVTGLSLIDTAVTDAILRTTRAIGLLGPKCIMTGLRPEVAATIVGLDVDLGKLATVATLRQGLERAARRA